MKATKLVCPVCMEESIEIIEKLVYICKNESCNSYNKEQNEKLVLLWTEYVDHYHNGDRYPCPICNTTLRDSKEWKVEDKIKSLSDTMKNPVGLKILVKSTLSARLRGQVRYPEDSEFYCPKCKEYFRKWQVQAIKKPIEVKL